MVVPRFTDLRAMAGELEVDPRYEKMGHAIKMVLVAQSCVADLSQSSDCCKALRALLLSPRKKGTIERAAVESSLLANAIMLYARATSTVAKKGERGAIQIDAKLTLAQKIDHNILVDIRNRALAHVYAAEPIAGELWHDQIMFAVEVDGLGWRPAGGSRRVQFDNTTLERLERQLPIARDLVRARSQKRIEAVTRMLNEQPVPVSLFETHLFDAIERFGSPAAVQNILEGMISGEATALS